MAIETIGKNASSIVGSRTFAMLTFTPGGIGGQALQASADLLSALNTNVSVNFIPIFSETVNMTRVVDVSSIMLADLSTGKKEYVVDNTAPQPRIWNVSGYIKNLVPVLESTLVVKPTLLLQKYLLDYYSQARTTVIFRDESGEIIDVVIKQLDFTYDAKATNAYGVRLVLQEAVTIRNVAAELKDGITGSAAPASIPTQIATDVGAVIAKTLETGTIFAGSYFVNSILAGLADVAVDGSTDNKLVNVMLNSSRSAIAEETEPELDIPDGYKVYAMPELDNDGELEFNATLVADTDTYLLRGYFETDELSSVVNHWIFVLTNAVTEEEITIVINPGCRYEVKPELTFVCNNPTVESEITVDNLKDMQFYMIKQEDI